MLEKSEKIWGGRFTAKTDVLVEDFTESVRFDNRLYKQDIEGSIAHSKMLSSIGVLSKEEANAIEKGLQEILISIEKGEFVWHTEYEDVHMNIEVALTDKIGDTGKKLHTARSRNDQVATDIRLYLRETSDQIIALCKTLQETILLKADSETDTIMPGFTHLQVAQPVSLAHHLLAWFEMLDRDIDRLQDCRKRINIMPLGSAALAGSSFSVDRQMTCELLGFDAPSKNSLDAVSDRDFLIEFSSCASLTMMHLSRMCEELVLWSSEAYRFVQIGDAFCTGSSIMPQKKNPDIAELIRGKSARVFGALQTLLTLMKAQPLAYNRDNQEDKEPVFDVVDTLVSCLRVFTAMLPSVEFHRDNMYKAALQGYATATDLAEYLVRLSVPFRDAHAIVGKTVRYAIEQNKLLSELSLQELRNFGAMINEDVFPLLTLEGSLNARQHFGGTAPSRVKEALCAAHEKIENYK